LCFFFSTAMAMAARNGVLIAGDSEAARAMAQRIVEVGQAAAVATSPDAAGASGAWAWTITTKYFTADVVVRAAGARVPAEAMPAARATDTDALILLELTRAELALWRDALAELPRRPGVVLVAAHDGGAPSEAATTAAREWALDNGAEFVDLAAQSVGREKEGVDRIVEALQTNEWENMARKQQPTPQPQAPSSPPHAATAAAVAAAPSVLAPAEAALLEGAIAASFGDEDVNFEAALGKLQALRDRA
jgi:hypothetical protein